MDYGRTTALGSQVSDSARVTDHSVELTGLSPNTTYRFRVSSVDAAGNSATLPGAARRPARFQTPPGRASWTTGPPSSAPAPRLAPTPARRWPARDGEVQLQPTVGEEFEGALPAGWEVRSWGPEGQRDHLRRRARRRRRVRLHDRLLRRPAGARVQRRRSSPVNDQAVGLRRRPERLPLRGLQHRRRRAALSASTPRAAAAPSTETAHAAPGREPQRPAPLPHRVEPPRTSRFYVDGALVATHSVTIDRLMRPAASDYGLFGAGVQVRLAAPGRLRRPPARSPRACSTAGPARPPWQTLTAQAAVPGRHADRLRHPLGRHAAARRRLVGVAARGRGRSDREPGGPLHPVPRPHDEHHRRVDRRR